MSMESGQNQEPEKYSFLQEKIKDETVSRKTMLYKLSCLVGRGILFGIAASIGFFALKPMVESVFHGNPDKIELTRDEQEVEQPDESRQAEEPQEELTIEKYKEWNALLIQTATEAKKSVVEVTGISTEESLAGNVQGSVKKSAGLLAGDNGQELLVLTSTSVAQDSDDFQIRFNDGTQSSAVLKKQDRNLGLAVVGVQKNTIKSEIGERIKVAALGNSNVISQGKTLIALGSPFGYSDGMGFGIVSSKERNRKLADGEYRMMITDMPGTQKSSGALFDVDGSVVGIIVPSESGDQEGALCAFGISTVKSEIELMMNGKDVPYIGIVGEFVTEEIAEAQNIPMGICVTEVMPDSPAMKAGIQNGDIISHVDKTKIESLLGYHSAMVTKEIGEEILLKGKRRGSETYVPINFTVTVGIKE